MSENEKQLREILARIAEMADAAANHNGHQDNRIEDDEISEDQEVSHGLPETQVGCTIKSLPKRLLLRASKVAATVNPVNSPVLGSTVDVAADIIDPLRLAVLTSKYWGAMPRRLTVSFMERTPSDLRARILSHMNAWSQTCSISFVETQGTGNVRISRRPGGYWSYLGTDILLIPSNRPTMNLEGFTMSTSESEFIRVVRHETGHTLGFPHEHMRRELVARIDPEKAYDYFRRTQGWNRQTVDQQVLTPLDQSSIMGTPADQTSIMCYQLPGSITFDGQPVLGGRDINPTDYEFAGLIYPKPGFDLTHEHKHEHEHGEEWDESEDVQDVQLEALPV